jgi:hypothetical protein
VKISVLQMFSSPESVIQIHNDIKASASPMFDNFSYYFAEDITVSDQIHNFCNLSFGAVYVGRTDIFTFYRYFGIDLLDTRLNGF